MRIFSDSATVEFCLPKDTNEFAGFGPTWL